MVSVSYYNFFYICLGFFALKMHISFDQYGDTGTLLFCHFLACLTVFIYMTIDLSLHLCKGHEGNTPGEELYPSCDSIYREFPLQRVLSVFFLSLSQILI